MDSRLTHNQATLDEVLAKLATRNSPNTQIHQALPSEFGIHIRICGGVCVYIHMYIYYVCVCPLAVLVYHYKYTIAEECTQKVDFKLLYPYLCSPCFAVPGSRPGGAEVHPRHA